MDYPKILIAGLIRNRAWILPDYLEHIRVLDTDGMEVGYYFIVDSSTDESLKLVMDTVIGEDIENPLWGKNAVIACNESEVDEDTRGFTARRGAGIYEHLRMLREKLRTTALSLGYDYLFCIDSDILVKPDSLKVLLGHKKDFVAFTVANNPLGKPEKGVNALSLSGKLNSPYAIPPSWGWWKYGKGGLVKVGATGAGFLASRKVLSKTSYYFEPSKQEIRLLEAMPGEDEWFALSCIRAKIDQFLDEEHVVFHAYTPKLYRRYKSGKTSGRGGSKAKPVSEG